MVMRTEVQLPVDNRFYLGSQSRQIKCVAPSATGQHMRVPSESIRRGYEALLLTDYSGGLVKDCLVNSLITLGAISEPFLVDVSSLSGRAWPKVDASFPRARTVVSKRNLSIL